MIQEVSDWIRCLAYLVLAVTFLELLVPENQMNRLVRVVVGFFVTAAMVMPVINWARSGRGFAELPFYSNTVETSTITQAARFQDSGSRQAAAIYRSSIELEVARRLEEAGIKAKIGVNWSPENGVSQVTARLHEEQESERAAKLLTELLSLNKDQVRIE